MGGLRIEKSVSTDTLISDLEKQICKENRIDRRSFNLKFLKAGKVLEKDKKIGTYITESGTIHIFKLPKA